MNKPKKPDWSKKNDSTIRNLYYRRRAHCMPLEPELQAELIARFPGYDPISQEFISRTDRKQDTDATIIEVEIKTEKNGKVGIYINGRIMTRVSSGSEVKTLSNGTLLSIHHINTDPIISDSWTVYDTKLTPNKWNHRYIVSYKVPTIQHVTDSPIGVQLSLSNKCTLLLEHEKLKRQANNKVFKIVHSKTK